MSTLRVAAIDPFVKLDVRNGRRPGVLEGASSRRLVGLLVPLGARSRARVGHRIDSLRSHPHAYRAKPLLACSRRNSWALLLARIDAALPLLCPMSGTEMRIIAFITDGRTVRDLHAQPAPEDEFDQRVAW